MGFLKRGMPLFCLAGVSTHRSTFCRCLSAAFLLYSMMPDLALHSMMPDLGTTDSVVFDAVIPFSLSLVSACDFIDSCNSVLFLRCRSTCAPTRTPSESQEGFLRRPTRTRSRRMTVPSCKQSLFFARSIQFLVSNVLNANPFEADFVNQKHQDDHSLVSATVFPFIISQHWC